MEGLEEVAREGTSLHAPASACTPHATSETAPKADLEEVHREGAVLEAQLLRRQDDVLAPVLAPGVDDAAVHGQPAVDDVEGADRRHLARGEDEGLDLARELRARQASGAPVRGTHMRMHEPMRMSHMPMPMHVPT